VPCGRGPWDAAAAPREASDAAARLAEAQASWDAALTAIDEARKTQMAAPGCKNQRRRRLPRWTGVGRPGLPLVRGTAQARGPAPAQVAARTHFHDGATV
jgi:hypothetical protein